jgi:hypothetical protein
MPARKGAKAAHTGKAIASRQKAILGDIAYLQGSLKKYNRAWESFSAKEQKDVVAEYRRYEKVMVQACRAGLADHSLVREWVGNRRLLGSWDLLRQARAGLEKGVKRPIPYKCVELWDTITRLQDPPAPGKRGRSLEAIRRLLIKRGDIAPMTQQAFNKLVARLNMVEWSLTATVGQRKTIYRFEITEKYPGVVKVRSWEEHARKRRRKP